MTGASITTTRFSGRPISTGDLDDLLDLFGDRQVMRTLSADGEPLPPSRVRELLQRALQHWDEHGYGIWVFRTADGEFVGRAGIQHKRLEGRDEVEILYALACAWWGVGAATEIARALVDAAFREYGLSELVCFALADNGGSRRVMEKVGFEYRRDFTHVDLPHALYRLDRRSWMAGRRP